VTDWTSLIQKTRNLQKELAVLQARLSNLLEKLEFQTINQQEVNARTFLEIIPGGVKITIFDEYPPKVSVYDRVSLTNGKLNNYAYAEARNRWYSLLKRATEGYEGDRIVPCFVYIVYFVPYLCDVGNFINKFILDGLMYYGPAPLDDNFENVNAVVQEAVLDKENPRTEIYVMKNTGRLRSVLSQNSS